MACLLINLTAKDDQAETELHPAAWSGDTEWAKSL